MGDDRAVTLDVVATAVVVVLATPYLWHAVRLAGWSPWRTVIHLLACALVWWCLAGTPATLRRSDSVWGVIGVALTNALAGFGLVAAQPVHLWEESHGRRARWLRGRLAQILGFPLVAGALNSTLIIVTFTSSWFSRSLSDDRVWAGLIVASLLAGFVANLQLASPDFVPRWVSPGTRLALAFVDGLIDEVPGIVVMAVVRPLWGGVLWGAVQPIVIPMMAVILLDWLRHERTAARDIDATLDSIEASGGSTDTPWWLAESAGAPSPATVAPELDHPPA